MPMHSDSGSFASQMTSNEGVVRVLQERHAGSSHSTRLTRPRSFIPKHHIGLVLGSGQGKYPAPLTVSNKTQLFPFTNTEMVSEWQIRYHFRLHLDRTRLYQACPGEQTEERNARQPDDLGANGRGVRPTG